MRLFNIFKKGDEFEIEIREARKLAKRALKKMKGIEKATRKSKFKKKKWGEILEFLLPEELLDPTDYSESEVIGSHFSYNKEL
ncbi:MAG: hypothetical protein QW291_06910 [Thermofilaceae archaeon]